MEDIVDVLVEVKSVMLVWVVDEDDWCVCFDVVDTDVKAVLSCICFRRFNFEDGLDNVLILNPSQLFVMQRLVLQTVLQFPRLFTHPLSHSRQH